MEVLRSKNMHIIKIWWILIAFVPLFSGCAPKFNCRFAKPDIKEKIVLPVNEIKIENLSIHKKKTGRLYPDKLYAPANVQMLFNDSVKDTINRCLVSAEGVNKAIIRIKDTNIYRVSNEYLNFPFTGLVMLAAGYESEYVATIAGTIEIENENCQVVDKVDFEIISKTKDKTGVNAEIERGYNTVASKAINEIYTELSKNVKYVLK